VGVRARLRRGRLAGSGHSRSLRWRWLGDAAKLLGGEAGFRACDSALQTFGGFGYSREFHVERVWREVRLFRIAPVTQEMVLNYLAERVLELPKSY
jgi:alkylation response protein AidB-like acyl-CoA dehydrogenase